MNDELLTVAAAAAAMDNGPMSRSSSRSHRHSEKNSTGSHVLSTKDANKNDVADTAVDVTAVVEKGSMKKDEVEKAKKEGEELPAPAAIEAEGVAADTTGIENETTLVLANDETTDINGTQSIVDESAEVIDNANTKSDNGNESDEGQSFLDFLSSTIADYKGASVNDKLRPIELASGDRTLLRSSILFKHWKDTAFDLFVKDSSQIHLRKFKYKEVVSKEKDCDEKIYVIKSGEVLVWIKMKRSNAKKHQMLLENFTSRQTASTNVDALKSKLMRDKRLEADSHDRSIKSHYPAKLASVVAGNNNNSSSSHHHHHHHVHHHHYHHHHHHHHHRHHRHHRPDLAANNTYTTQPHTGGGNYHHQGRSHNQQQQQQQSIVADVKSRANMSLNTSELDNKQPTFIRNYMKLKLKPIVYPNLVKTQPPPPPPSILKKTHPQMPVMLRMNRQGDASVATRTQAGLKGGATVTSKSLPSTLTNNNNNKAGNVPPRSYFGANGAVGASGGGGEKHIQFNKTFEIIRPASVKEPSLENVSFFTISETINLNLIQYSFKLPPASSPPPPQPSADDEAGASNTSTSDSLIVESAVIDESEQAPQQQQQQQQRGNSAAVCVNQTEMMPKDMSNKELLLLRDDTNYEKKQQQQQQQQREDSLSRLLSPGVLIDGVYGESTTAKKTKPRLKRPEMWMEEFQQNEAFCFIKMMHLSAHEFFGLSDLLFKEQVGQDDSGEDASSKLGAGDANSDGGDGDDVDDDENDLFGEKSSSDRSSIASGGDDDDDDEDDDDEAAHKSSSLTVLGDATQWLATCERAVNSKKPNKYHLIANSAYVECYVIDKSAYLKQMLAFSSDKSVLNQYLDDLLPTSKMVNQQFTQHLSWNIFKKQAYRDQLDLIKLERRRRQQRAKCTSDASFFAKRAPAAATNYSHQSSHSHTLSQTINKHKASAAPVYLHK